MQRTCSVIFLLFWLTASAVAQQVLTFDAWKTRCMSTPANRELKGRIPAKEQLPIAEYRVVLAQARRLLEHYRQGAMSEPENWVGNQPTQSEFFDIARTYFTRPSLPFQPFTQKVAIEPGSKIIFHGDFHGDIRSFISTLDWLSDQDYLDGFKIKNRKTYLVFLGDYVDRGSYGVEVIYTLMRLKLENPDNVFMVRGNHEDFQMTTAYGFLREGQMKYGRQFNPLPIWRIYDFLPVVIYMGTGSNYVQCNHGGMEPGYDPTSLLGVDGNQRFQLLGDLKQIAFAKEHPEWLKKESEATKLMAASRLSDFRPKSPTSPAPIGFMWNDFSLFARDPGLAFNPSRLAFLHGQASTKYLLQQGSVPNARIRAVFRAHQHSSVPNPMMQRLVVSRGVFRHWQHNDRASQSVPAKAGLETMVETTASRPIPDDSVWTFNVSPDSVYGAGNDYSFDTVGVLETSESFADWRLKVVNVLVSSK